MAGHRKTRQRREPAAGRRHAARAKVATRDQALSVFNAILMRLCHATSAQGAALVDLEGETVDYYSEFMAPYEMRVTAAEWRLVLRVVQESAILAWRETELMLVRAKQRSYAVMLLTEGYALVLQLAHGCFNVSERALAEASRQLCTECGFPPPLRLKRAERWTRIRVQTARDDKWRPSHVWQDRGWRPVTILGRYQRMDLAGREVGYRVRLATGAEFSLVREPLGVWYAESLD